VNPVKYFFLNLFYGAIKRGNQLVKTYQDWLDEKRYWRVRKNFDNIADSLGVNSINEYESDLIFLIAVEISTRKSLIPNAYSNYVRSVKSYQWNNPNWNNYQQY